MITVRPLHVSDVDAAAGVLRDAFDGVYREHGHEPPFPSVESATWLCRAYLDLDPTGCAVAIEKQTGRTVGVGFVHPRGAAASIGPVAALPGGPRGVGRAIMAYLTTLADGATSLRLFQDSFNPDSFGLYSRLGYVVRDVGTYLMTEELVPPAEPPSGLRALQPGDLGRVEAYDEAWIGADRCRDLAFLARSGSGLVSESDGRIDGYLLYRAMSGRAIVGPAVADSEARLLALLDGVAAALSGRAAVIRASARSPAAVERAFAIGFRVDHLGNLMVRGDFVPPPAQLYALFPESL